MCDPGHQSSLKNGWAHISMGLMWEEGHTPRGSSQSLGVHGLNTWGEVGERHDVDEYERRGH